MEIFPQRIVTVIISSRKLLTGFSAHDLMFRIRIDLKNSLRKHAPEQFEAVNVSP